MKDLPHKPWFIYVLLLLSSVAIYFYFFGDVLLHLNQILSSVTGDSLKNHFTFAWHAKYDSGPLSYSGMNYPYTEHIIYADAQPLFSNLLRFLPFTHNYLGGIVNGLVFIFMMITPLVLCRIMRICGSPKGLAFFSSLAIGVLSPQYYKVYAGHYALAYSAFIPLAILMSLHVIRRPGITGMLAACILNFLLFFIHPYLGFVCSMICFLTLLIHALMHRDLHIHLKMLLPAFLTGALPLLMFGVFMRSTDVAFDRATEPFGREAYLANAGSFLLPNRSPFSTIIESLIPVQHAVSEAYSYLGLFTMCGVVVLVILIPFRGKQMNQTVLNPVFMCALLFAFMSFGLHFRTLDALGINIAAVNQFRAAGRFAWVLYYVLPLYLMLALSKLLEKRRLLLLCTGVIFFVVNLSEAASLFDAQDKNFWNCRNFFNKDLLNDNERAVLAGVENKKPQAIITIPTFQTGSELFERLECNNTFISATLFSFHSGLPMHGTISTRNSFSMTENGINLLNGYVRDNPARALITPQPFLVLRSDDPLMPDEQRIDQVTEYFQKGDTLSAGWLQRADLFKEKEAKTKIMLSDTTSGQVVFVKDSGKKPFIRASMEEYETVAVVDSNQDKTGKYVVSLWYHPEKKTWKSMSCNLIVTRAQGKEYKWQHNFRMNLVSGIYCDFVVFEQNIILEGTCRYEFVTKGTNDGHYRISHFMLRPADTDVIQVMGKDTIINNFPLR
jgi:hypothetical protein